MAKPETIEVMTHKTGKFVFSAEYDELVIAPKLERANALYEFVDELPVLPHVLAELNKELSRRSIHGTAAIEGNPLSEEEVGRILESKPTDELKARAEQEIANLQELYTILETPFFTPHFFEIKEEFIRNVHHRVTTNLNYHHNVPGAYRNETVRVGDNNHGGVYKPPKTLDDIQNLMKTFCSWVNSDPASKIDPFIRAPLAHYYIGKIHPFMDGNGRTARFIEAMLLKYSNKKYLPPLLSNYYYKHMDDYFIAFSTSQSKTNRKDVTPFLSFFLDGVLNALAEIKEKIVRSVRILALKDYYATLSSSRQITKRQSSLLATLLETNKRFDLDALYVDPVFKPLYENVSTSTARRDLKKLAEQNLLIRAPDTKKYHLNYRVLG